MSEGEHAAEEDRQGGHIGEGKQVRHVPLGQLQEPHEQADRQHTAQYSLPQALAQERFLDEPLRGTHQVHGAGSEVLAVDRQPDGVVDERDGDDQQQGGEEHDP